MDNSTVFKRRGILCLIIALIIFGAYVARLFVWQIVDGEKYKDIAKNNSTYSLVSDRTRGEILTADGKPLATNRTLYNVALKKAYIKEGTTNSTIIKVLDLLKTRNEEWRDMLPIIYKDGKYSFAESDTAEEYLSYLQSEAMLDTGVYTMPDEYMKELIKRYECKDI